MIWHFTLVLIKINYGQIGDQTGLFYTTNQYFIPVEIDLSIVLARLGISDFFTTLIPSDNRNTRSTCPTSVFTGTGQTLMLRPNTTHNLKWGRRGRDCMVVGFLIKVCQ